jgi:hypothetical protein
VRAPEGEQRKAARGQGPSVSEAPLGMFKQQSGYSGIGTFQKKSAPIKTPLPTPPPCRPQIERKIDVFIA